MVTIIACNVVIRLCLTHKGTSIENACFRCLGAPGKRVAEISIMGLMTGVIIGYDVSLADLGAGIVTQVSKTLAHQKLRIVMLALLTVAITPLCLISRVQSLIRMSSFAMVFYTAMLLHMILLGGPKLLSGGSHLVWWQPDGLIRCIPIFFASFFCQTQLMTIYTGLHQPSVSAMHDVVKFGVGIMSIAYGLFGLLGYMAFVDYAVPGNVFLLYPDDSLSFCVQAGFLFTIAVSIPLTLFPLRRSVDSFIKHQDLRYNSISELEDGFDYDMPAKRFRLMTAGILVLCFSFSLTTDKIEVIIQLTSSLSGSVIGYILPSLAVLSTYGVCRSAKERRIAIGLAIVGLCLFVIGSCSVAFHGGPQTNPAYSPSMLAVDREKHSPPNPAENRMLPAPHPVESKLLPDKASPDGNPEVANPNLQPLPKFVQTKDKNTRIEMMRTYLRAKESQPDQKVELSDPNGVQKVIHANISEFGSSSNSNAAIPAKQQFPRKSAETVVDVEVKEPKLPVDIANPVKGLPKESFGVQVTEEDGSIKSAKNEFPEDAVKVPVEVVKPDSPPPNIGSPEDGSSMHRQPIHAPNDSSMANTTSKSQSTLIEQKLLKIPAKQNGISIPPKPPIKLPVVDPGRFQSSPSDTLTTVRNKTESAGISMPNNLSNEQSMNQLDSSSSAVPIPILETEVVYFNQPSARDSQSRGEPAQVTRNISNQAHHLHDPDTRFLSSAMIETAKQMEEAHFLTTSTPSLESTLNNGSLLIPVELQAKPHNAVSIDSLQSNKPLPESQVNDEALKHIDAHAFKSHDIQESKNLENEAEISDKPDAVIKKHQDVL